MGKLRGGLQSGVRRVGHATGRLKDNSFNSTTTLGEAMAVPLLKGKGDRESTPPQTAFNMAARAEIKMSIWAHLVPMLARAPGPRTCARGTVPPVSAWAPQPVWSAGGFCRLCLECPLPLLVSQVPRDPV